MSEASLNQCYQANLEEVQRKIKKGKKDGKKAIAYIVRLNQENRDLTWDEQESIRQKISDHFSKEGFVVKRAFHNNLVIGLGD